jgi:glucose-6-phosphate 1-epimerase
MKTRIEAIEFRGIPAWRLHGPRGAVAVVSGFGGQVLSWVTPDGRERLFLSDRAVFDGRTAIRGGIPVCFPQFAAQGDLPRHGFVRTREWSCAAERCAPEYALLSLETGNDDTTLALWPHPFRLELTVILEADRLDLELCVVNCGGESLSFTGALHTYLRTVQVEDIALEGLYGFYYRDATVDGRLIRETGTELAVDREIDRIYHGVTRPQLLRAGNLTLGIQAQGFPDRVVWNPWVERCAQLADMPANAWRHMLCVEAAVAERPVTLPPGGEWAGRQTLVAI